MNPDTTIRIVWNDPDTNELIGRTFALPMRIGRDETLNHLALPSAEVSRQHLEISSRGGQWYFQDLGSANKVKVNEKRRESGTLEPGDQLRVGPFLLVVETPVPTLGVVWTAEDQRTKQVTRTTGFRIGRRAACDVVLSDPKVSGEHAEIERTRQGWLIKDLGSTNGTRVNGIPITQPTALKEGDQIQIGPFTLAVRINEVVDRPTAPAAAQGVRGPLRTEVIDLSGRADFPPAFFQKPVVSLNDITNSGLPVSTKRYAAIGAGMGSFMWVDLLRISGVKTEDIVALGNFPAPYEHYRGLVRNSQIPNSERLRSNSDSCPDNIWGWPGYAVREAWEHFKGGRFGRMFTVLWQIFGEPAIAETYTPPTGMVWASMDREARRIRWSKMYQFGNVRALRKTEDGRYVIAYSSASDSQRRHGLLLANYVQLATGYPALRFLDDLQRYREETGDLKTFVNAYEDHDHVYKSLERTGGVVIVRGRGIVASRVLQRLWEARQINPKINIIHLLRKPLTEGSKYGRAQRFVHKHIEFQPFNWPKACWGGELRGVLESANLADRKDLFRRLGGTTTAYRQDWLDIVDTGSDAGWYEIKFGEVTQVKKNGNRATTVVRDHHGQGTHEVHSDFIIDATGLEAGVKRSPFLADLVNTYGLPLNHLERIQVSNDFEVEGLRSNKGKVYAAGAMTLGGPYAPVDSFLGLLYAAQRSVDHLHRNRAPSVRYLNGFRSFWQWLKWVRGVEP